MLCELLRLRCMGVEVAGLHPRYLRRVCEPGDGHSLLARGQQLALPHLRYKQIHQLEGLTQEVVLRFPIDQEVVSRCETSSDG